MITAQDIREKTFEKAKFGGYDMASVDDFLEELADDITASQKENAVLKSKMKVLVDKIEEYRANEEALNLAVLSAQKLAVQIETDARQRATAMIADADRQVKAKIGSIEEETIKQERRLESAKTATAKFIAGVRAMCNAQLKNIDAINSGTIGMQEPVKAAAKVEAEPAVNYDAVNSGIITKPETEKVAGQNDVEDTIRSIESSVAKIKPEPAINIDFSSEGKAPLAQEKAIDNTQPFFL